MEIERKSGSLLTPCSFKSSAGAITEKAGVGDVNHNDFTS